jgi:hypothetical protein
MTVQTTQSFAFLGEIVERVRDGRLAPAAFQRPYVWTRHDVEEMWASIVSRDPLGGILLWTPGDEDVVRRMARSRLGPVDLVPGPRSTLVLDGQNRLVTLAWSMVDPEEVDDAAPGAGTWRADDMVLAAVPSSESRGPAVRFVPRDQVRGLTTPTWKLFDNHVFNRHVRENWDGQGVDGEIAIDWLTRVQDSVREARVVVSTIEGGTAEQARRRLLRIARVGVPMSEEDFDAIANAS